MDMHTSRQYREHRGSTALPLPFTSDVSSASSFPLLHPTNQLILLPIFLFSLITSDHESSSHVGCDKWSSVFGVEFDTREPVLIGLSSFPPTGRRGWFPPYSIHVGSRRLLHPQLQLPAAPTLAPTLIIKTIDAPSA